VENVRFICASFGGEEGPVGRPVVTALFMAQPGRCTVSGPRFFFYRLFGPNPRPPVPVNQTGLTGYQKKPAKFKFQTNNGSSTGFHRLADRLDW